MVCGPVGVCEDWLGDSRDYSFFMLYVLKWQMIRDIIKFLTLRNLNQKLVCVVQFIK